MCKAPERENSLGQNLGPLQSSHYKLCHSSFPTPHPSHIHGPGMTNGATAQHHSGLHSQCVPSTQTACNPIFAILCTHCSPVEGGDLHSVSEQKAELTTCQAWENCTLSRLFPRAVQGELVLCRVWRSFKFKGWETSSGWNVKALVDL